MIYCRTCVMPSTRPDTPFVDGVCQACINYARRPSINWAERRRALADLLERGRNTSGFDCIVPSSGGKDSHYQVLKLLALGAKPLVVTATTCHLTKIGRLNIDNLARYATTIEVTPDRTVRAKLNRLGMELVGDISWPEHVAIFTIPFRMAAALGIPLIFYGENPQDQYGGPQGTEEARQMTRRWRSEFGGFLGLRPIDLADAVGGEHHLQDYQMPTEDELERAGVQAHFLGQYLPWDSHENARIAKDAGMVQVLPSSANWWPHENLDNAQTGIHDHQMHRKYGYGRAAAQASVDVRTGRLTMSRAIDVVKLHGTGELPEEYMGVSVDAVLERLQMPRRIFDALLDRFTNRAVYQPTREEA